MWIEVRTLLLLLLCDVIYYYVIIYCVIYYGMLLKIYVWDNCDIVYWLIIIDCYCCVIIVIVGIVIVCIGDRWRCYYVVLWLCVVKLVWLLLWMCDLYYYCGDDCYYCYYDLVIIIIEITNISNIIMMKKKYLVRNNVICVVYVLLWLWYICIFIVVCVMCVILLLCVIYWY